MIRLRIRVVDWPRRALVVTDTPRPDCPVCEGLGGIEHPYGDASGEYAGSDWEPCGCWDDSRRWTLLPLPRRLRRTPPGGYSSEPPF
ncbi:hypothetical protein QD712_06935 [Streptomyces acidiscabies]|uniref:hypothetical protein n=1 Tax=Streptomyces acidiscabies TaxID=42234 RepID=UPI0030CBF468